MSNDKFGFMRVEKMKAGACYGIHSENNRNADNQKEFNGKIDWNKTNENMYFVKSDNFMDSIKDTLIRCGITKKPRKDAVLFLDTVYTGSPEFFEKKSKDEIINYFQDCLSFHRKTFGDYIFNAVIHFDETTPHMHIQSVPIVDKGNGQHSLSAKALLGNKREYSNKQELFEHEVCLPWGMNPRKKKDPNKGKDHITNQEHIINEHNKTIAEQEKTIERNQGIIISLEEKDYLQGQAKSKLNKLKGTVTIPYEDYKHLVNRAELSESIELRLSHVKTAERQIEEKKHDILEIAQKHVNKRYKMPYEYCQGIGLIEEVNKYSRLAVVERTEFEKMYKSHQVKSVDDYRIFKEKENARLYEKSKDKGLEMDIQYSYER